MAIPKKITNIFIPILHLFPSLFFPSSSICLSPRSFLSLFLSFRPIPVFSLLLPTSESPLSNPLLHLVSLILSLLSCLSVSFFLSLSSTFIHFPFALNLSTSSLSYLTLWYISFSPSSPCSFSFLSNIPSVSCSLPFHPLCPQILPLFFPISISPYSSCTLPSLCNMAFLYPLLTPISNIFLALSLPPLVPSIPTMLLNIITLLKKPPHFLSAIPHTHLTTLLAFLTIVHSKIKKPPTSHFPR
jgi:hypothetical protein